MKKILFSTSILIILSAVMLMAQNTIDIKKPAYINADVLNIRNTPSSSGSKVGTFSQGEKITLSKKSDKTDKVGDKTDYWYFASANRKSGWIFGAFLTQDDEVVKILTLNGKYYLKSVKYPTDKQNTILTLKGTTFILLESDYYGSTYEIKGDMMIEGSHILLEPKTKLFTASDSLLEKYGLDYNNSGTVEDIENGSYEYKSYSDTLVILTCGSKNYIASSKRNDDETPSCDNINYSYEK